MPYLTEQTLFYDCFSVYLLFPPQSDIFCFILHSFNPFFYLSILVFFILKTTSYNSLFFNLFNLIPLFFSSKMISFKQPMYYLVSFLILLFLKKKKIVFVSFRSCFIFVFLTCQLGLFFSPPCRRTVCAPNIKKPVHHPFKSVTPKQSGLISARFLQPWIIHHKVSDGCSWAAKSKLSHCVMELLEEGSEKLACALLTCMYLLGLTWKFLFKASDSQVEAELNDVMSVFATWHLRVAWSITARPGWNPVMWLKRVIWWMCLTSVRSDAI